MQFHFTDCVYMEGSMVNIKKNYGSQNYRKKIVDIYPYTIE